ncbi:MAG TPA: zinc ribbon domain-containing protein [Actinomycetota bacterium]|nr:zinc ribbon domain-containing protein [Actinomycetota bacterium]
MDELRCPSCGALVIADAEWCGQCFTSLKDASDPEPATTSVISRPAIEGERREGGAGATWPCPTCGSQNPIELDECSVCGTSFAQLLRQDEPRPTVSPRDAFLWSLTFPGVGHAKAGRAADGIARGTLFVLAFGLALVIVLSGVSSAPIFGVVSLLLVSALTIYLGSAAEAYRIADGGSPFVSARTLLWATVALIMVSVSLLAMSVVTVNSR